MSLKIQERKSLLREYVAKNLEMNEIFNHDTIFINEDLTKSIKKLRQRINELHKQLFDKKILN